MKTANMRHQPDSAPPGQTTSPWNIRPLRRLCGLAIAAIGLALLIVVFESAFPHTAVLGRINRSSVYR